MTRGSHDKGTPENHCFICDDADKKSTQISVKTE